jgi:hypothetical protein
MHGLLFQPAIYRWGSYLGKGWLKATYWIRIGTDIKIKALYNDFCEPAQANDVHEVFAITTRKHA